MLTNLTIAAHVKIHFDHSNNSLFGALCAQTLRLIEIESWIFFLFRFSCSRPLHKLHHSGYFIKSRDLYIVRTLCLRFVSFCLSIWMWQKCYRTKIRAEQFTTVMIKIECIDFNSFAARAQPIDVRSNKIVKLSRDRSDCAWNCIRPLNSNKLSHCNRIGIE